MDAKRFLSDVGSSVHERFVADRSILSFDEYLQGFFAAPRRHARGIAQYLLDVFDHYGVEERSTPVGSERHYRLFDAPFAGGRGRIAGQDEVAGAIHRILRNFARQGRNDRLILMHGPNGSAKSSIVSALMAAMEDYSHQPQGARYRFNWVFPSEKLVKGTIGFGGGGSPGDEPSTYAHLEGPDVEARIVCEMKDHPLLLVPKAERHRMLEGACKPAEKGAPDGEFVLPDYLTHGELCQKCSTIFNALMASYGGDWSKVMAHVQVERFYYSRRYLSGAVTVEPQMSVDANVRALSMDRTAANLPAAIQTVTLLEAFGPLANGNRGIVEYSDMLKRPLEAFKYLLGTSETAEVRMEHMVLQLDAILVASSNEDYLAAFKESPDFTSFKGRTELVRVPYLRRYSVERQIYADQITPAAVGKHIDPHAVDVAAQWAVLTRLMKPNPERYPTEIRATIDELQPWEKLVLYDTGAPPDRLPMQQARELRSHAAELFHESDTYPRYEGRSGASAREVKTVLLNASQHPKGEHCLTSSAVLEELRALVKDKSVYAFLLQEVKGGYHDHERFVEDAESAWLDRVDDEVRDALGLVAEEQYRDWFGRYIRHVTAWVKGEKIKNRVTGAYEPPDGRMMEEMEAIVMGPDEDRDDFRRGLITAIGAFRLEHMDDEGALDWARIFPELFRRLRDHYYAERRRSLTRAHQNYLKWLDPEDRKGLSAKEKAGVEEMLSVLESRYGYCQHCARDAILALMRKRYRD